MCFSGNRRKWARSGSVDHGGEGEGGGGHWGPDENISPEVGITVFHA